MAKCPNCGSTAQTLLISEYAWRIGTDSGYYRKYKCGCGTYFTEKCKIIETKVLDKRRHI